MPSMGHAHLLGFLLALYLEIQEAEPANVCGSPLVSPRIVGGQDAQDGAWPWQVSIYVNSHPHCGGSLIANQWVLSAAHCFSPDFPAFTYKVVLGAYQLSNYSKNPNVISLYAKQVIINPAYKEADFSGDIALVELESPVRYTRHILPVCLPSTSVLFQPTMECWVTGWGSVDGDVPLPEPKTLQEVRVGFIDRQTCDALYQIGSDPSLARPMIQEDMVCAGYAEGQKDSCTGDSGGPLVCKVRDIWLQAGVVSWGPSPCALPNQPGVYASLTFYQSWIRDHVPEIEFVTGTCRLTASPSTLLSFAALVLSSYLINVC
ncbi:serine protease 27-like [Lissotriton helveticus]